MKKKIGILGSTGSIGENTVKIISKNINDFEVIFLSTNNNIKKLYKQSIKIRPRAVIIFDNKKFIKFKKKFIKKKIKVFNSFKDLKSSLIKKKIDYIMCAISGLSGLESTINSINITKNIAIANKESIICAWNLINKKLKKYKTKFIPVDSEHFSIWSLLKNEPMNNVEKIIITASGGPFLNSKLHKLKNVKSKDAIKHPNWKMGKKITIDSATMMNKVFEVIEANKLFKFDIKKIKILIHPSSYIHSIVKFKNGTSTMLAHETNMRIPIGNAIFENYEYDKKFNDLNLKKINKMKFFKPKINQFPTLKLIDKLKNNDSYLEIILIAANDELVKYFLKRKIRYSDIIFYLNKILNMSIFKRKFKKKQKTVKEINQVVEIVKSKVKNLVY